MIFGAGLVTPPMFEYLLERGCHLVIATRSVHKIQPVVDEIEQRVNNGKKIEVVLCDIQDESHMPLAEQLIQDADIACSLLPWTLHLVLAKLAIKHKTHFATASYVSKPMQELDAEFKAAGIISLNECGVDPGLDHMSAMRVIHRAQKGGGKLRSFISLCGGLPAPQHNNNPMQVADSARSCAPAARHLPRAGTWYS